RPASLPTCVHTMMGRWAEVTRCVGAPLVGDVEDRTRESRPSARHSVSHRVSAGTTMCPLRTGVETCWKPRRTGAGRWLQSREMRATSEGPRYEVADMMWTL